MLGNLTLRLGLHWRKLFRIRDKSGTPQYRFAVLVDKSEKKKPLGLVVSPEILNTAFKVGTLNPETFESKKLCRENDFLSNPDIFPPADF